MKRKRYWWANPEHMAQDTAFVCYKKKDFDHHVRVEVRLAPKRRKKKL